VTGEIVCLASDRPLEPAQIERLTRPLIEDPGLMLVSGVDEPLSLCLGPRSGDRLTELVARPLVARYEPALAGLRHRCCARSRLAARCCGGFSSRRGVAVAAD
jgi:hypothetical protein